MSKIKKLKKLANTKLDHEVSLDFAKGILDIRNTTFAMSHKTKKCKTWKDLAILLINEFSTDF